MSSNNSILISSISSILPALPGSSAMVLDPRARPISPTPASYSSSGPDDHDHVHPRALSHNYSWPDPPSFPSTPTASVISQPAYAPTFYNSSYEQIVVDDYAVLRRAFGDLSDETVDRLRDDIIYLLARAVKDAEVLRAEVSSMEYQLRWVKMAVFCAICGNAAQTPAVLTCGHVFCAHCIRTWFQKALELKIRTFLSSRSRQAILVPTTKRGLVNLCNKFINAGKSTKHMLSYNCYRCSSTIRKAPTVNQELGKVIYDISLSVPMIGTQSSDISHRRAPRFVDHFFAGLFLNTQ